MRVDLRRVALHDLHHLVQLRGKTSYVTPHLQTPALPFLHRTIVQRWCFADLVVEDLDLRVRQHVVLVDRAIVLDHGDSAS